MTDSRDDSGGGGSGQVKVDAAVRVFPGTPQEVYGFVVEDFGDFSGEAVDIGEHHIVDAARRWAVRLSDGSLVFVDDGDIVSID
jgi:hypothetical protein